MKKLLTLSKQLGDILRENKLFITTAESCTGGQIAEILTAIPGSSNYFDRGFVTYSNAAKQEMLNVPKEIIDRYGAVSEKTVCAMAQGALQHSHAQVSIAVSGIAGPEGGTAQKPVGTIWLAWGLAESTKEIEIDAKCYNLTGNRIQIRTQTVEIALQETMKIFSNTPL